MFRDVITRSTSLAQWESIREEIHERILGTMGVFPDLPRPGAFESLKEGEVCGLRTLELRFETVPGYFTRGTMVFPPAYSEDRKFPGALCVHGTDRVLAHRNVLSPDKQPNRDYAIELAQRGFVTLAVDQLGFGKGWHDTPPQDTVKRFSETFPNWSLDGVRLWVHQCALDLLTTGASVDATRLACIGNSLGGRGVVYLAAFDPRIRAAVPSTGVSPHLTNVFRGRPGSGSPSPRLSEQIAQTGKPLFDYHEILSLIAPRAVLVIEPWNDAYNPLIEAVFRCFEKARFVFELGEAHSHLQLLCHGDGHDTTPRVREYAYGWIEDRLK